MTTLAFLSWPDTFEDWYGPLGVDRAAYLDGYDGEWSLALAGALVDAGVDVHLVHGTLGTARTAVHRPSGATVHFVPASPAYRGLRRAVWGHRWWPRAQAVWPAAPAVSTLSARLLGRLRALRPDAVVVQDYETLRFDVAAPLLRALGLRVVGLDTGASARPSGLPWKRLTRGAAHRLLAVHAAEAARLRAAGHDRVDVWPVPVRTDVFRPAGRARARAALGLPPDEPLVVAAARLHPVKNLPLLADACRDLGVTLAVAGEGPARAELERRPGVRLLGWCAPAQTARWLAAADVAALSSNQEGQPVAVLEALACGRAVVATAVGGVPDVVRPGETGWLVPPRDAAALREALADALSDRDRADGYGAAGRELVLARHGAAAAARTVAALCAGAQPPATSP